MPGGAELSEKLPDELFQMVENFKKFIREQKSYRDQKFDVDPILEVEREADDLMLAFQRVGLDCDINKKLIQQTKDDTTKLLTGTPSQRFAELADQYEARMKLYGEQIKELKMSLDGIIRTHNADELFKLLDKQHKSLREIGAKVYMTHERIMEKKAELEEMSH